MKLFKKVYVSETNIPADNEYETNMGIVEVFCGNWVADDYPKWYLEEVELPTDKEIDSTFPLQYGMEILNFNTDCRKGAKWMRDSIGK